MDINFLDATALMLIFVRLCGMILFNPLFSRRNVPTRVQTGFILCLTILLSQTINSQHLINLTSIDLVISIFRELFLGFSCGIVFQIFYYFLFFVGDLMDVEFGLSMAKVFDPGTNVQMSVSGNLLNFILVIYIFATDTHLLIIQLFASSFKLIPVGTAAFSIELVKFVIDVFINTFSLAIRLLLPFAVAEFIVEVSMGILMKLVPQIHVFVINIQTKMLMGLLLMFLFAQPIAYFIDNYIVLLFDQMNQLFYVAKGLNGI
jgi:flagellar biosynthetic protein FliR